MLCYSEVFCFFFSLCFSLCIGVEPRTSQVLGKCFPTELYLQATVFHLRNLSFLSDFIWICSSSLFFAIHVSVASAFIFTSPFWSAVLKMRSPTTPLANIKNNTDSTGLRVSIISRGVYTEIWQTWEGVFGCVFIINQRLEDKQKALIRLVSLLLFFFLKHICFLVFSDLCLYTWKLWFPYLCCI